MRIPGSVVSSKFLAVADIAARDALNSVALGKGAWVKTLDTNKVYELVQQADPGGPPFFQDDFESYTIGNPIPAPWTHTGSTGSGNATVETTLNITSPLTNTVVPYGGTKMLFFGKLNGGKDTLQVAPGEYFANIAIDLTSYIGTATLTFRQRQIGDFIQPCFMFVSVTGPDGTDILDADQFQDQQSWPVDPVTLDLTPYMGQSITLKFHYYFDQFQADGCGQVIDNVLVAHPATPPIWKELHLGAGVLWTGDRVWDDVYAEFETNGFGNIYVVADPTNVNDDHHIVAQHGTGVYPLVSKAKFIGVGVDFYGQKVRLRINAGTHINNGAFASLDIENLEFFIQTNSGQAIIDPGCLLVVRMDAAILNRDVAGYGEFTDVLDGSSLQMTNGSRLQTGTVGANGFITIAKNGTLAVTMTAGSSCFAYTLGGQNTDSNPSYIAVLGDATSLDTGLLVTLPTTITGFQQIGFTPATDAGAFPGARLNMPVTQPSNGQNVTLGFGTFRFVTTLGAPETSQFQIQISGSIDQDQINLADAINGVTNAAVVPQTDPFEDNIVAIPKSGVGVYLFESTVRGGIPTCMGSFSYPLGTTITNAFWSLADLSASDGSQPRVLFSRSGVFTVTAEAIAAGLYQLFLPFYPLSCTITVRDAGNVVRTREEAFIFFLNGGTVPSPYINGIVEFTLGGGVAPAYQVGDVVTYHALGHL